MRRSASRIVSARDTLRVGSEPETLASPAGRVCLIESAEVATNLRRFRRNACTLSIPPCVPATRSRSSGLPLHNPYSLQPRPFSALVSKAYSPHSTSLQIHKLLPNLPTCLPVRLAASGPPPAARRARPRAHAGAAAARDPHLLRGVRRAFWNRGNCARVCVRVRVRVRVLTGCICSATASPLPSGACLHPRVRFLGATAQPPTRLSLRCSGYLPPLGPAHPAQDAVSAAGPLLTILGFLVFPLLWSVPEALITAELATAFPENRWGGGEVGVGGGGGGRGG